MTTCLLSRARRGAAHWLRVACLFRRLVAQMRMHRGWWTPPLAPCAILTRSPSCCGTGGNPPPISMALLA